MTKATIADVLKKDDWMKAANHVNPKRVLCRPDCPTCGGVGYVRYDVPVDDPRFGKLTVCPNIPPESSMHDGHGLTVEQIRSLSWKDIKLRENVHDAILVLHRVLKSGNGLVYLYGGAGLAKTMLLQIACAEWARMGCGVFRFTTQKDMLDDMRTAFDDDEPQRAILQKQDKYIGYPLLALDEVTTERSTEFKVEQFFHVVNKRHEAGTERREGFVTLMAGNVSPKELDYRVMDRLTDGRNVIFRMTGDSYRPAMRYEPEPVRGRVDRNDPWYRGEGEQ